MLVEFKNDDEYSLWLAQHPAGFVANMTRTKTPTYAVLVDSQDPLHLLQWWCHKGHVSLLCGDVDGGREAHHQANQLGRRTD